MTYFINPDFVAGLGLAESLYVGNALQDVTDDTHPDASVKSSLQFFPQTKRQSELFNSISALLSAIFISIACM